MVNGWICICLLVGIAAYTDLKNCRIPNWLAAAGAAEGLLGGVISGGWSGACKSVIGMVVGFGLMLLLHLLGAIGAGDVKLFGAMGAIGGAEFVYSTAVYSLLFAGLIGLAILAAKGHLRNRSLELGARLFGFIYLYQTDAITGMRKKKDMIRFPFLLAVVPGTAAALWSVWF